MSATGHIDEYLLIIKIYSHVILSDKVNKSHKNNTVSKQLIFRFILGKTANHYLLWAATTAFGGPVARLSLQI
jgi:predicted branched-subunit amino acid permease